MKYLLQYLVVFLILSNIFTYTYYSNLLKRQVSSLEKSIAKKSDSIQTLQLNNFKLSNFELSKNEAALDYFFDKNTNNYKSFDEINTLVMNGLYELNDHPEGNPLVGLEKLNQQKIIIEQYRILNHRWLIADFSDGVLNGEVLLKYFINQNNQVDFERLETIILPKQN